MFGNTFVPGGSGGGGLTPYAPADDFFWVGAITTLASYFTGTINAITGLNKITYNLSTGDENTLTTTSANLLAKMRLYNTTRGNYSLITSCNTGTNELTFFSDVPSNWAAGDVININSQKVTGAPFNFFDLEITDPTLKNKNFLILALIFNSSLPNKTLSVHPSEAFAYSKNFPAASQVAGVTVVSTTPPISIIDSCVSVQWSYYNSNTGMRVYAYG